MIFEIEVCEAAEVGGGGLAHFCLAWHPSLHSFTAGYYLIAATPTTIKGQVLVRAPPRLFRALFCLLIRLFRALPNT